MTKMIDKVIKLCYSIYIMLMKGKIMKKILMTAALVFTATTANAGDLDSWKLPANSVWNDSNTALQLPHDVRYIFNQGIDLEQAARAVISTVIDPRGYSGKAYPNGKRPKLNYKLGNLGTGKCYSDPKGNGIYCP